MAAPGTPAISFLVPYRWFNDDKKFLGENLRRMTEKSVGSDDMKVLEGILSYRIVIRYQFSKPVDFSITKAGLQKVLKKIFPNGKCLSAETQYVQSKNYPLPTCDFQIFL